MLSRRFPMSLTPGTRLGPYEIVTPLGAGGMGEVFRGRDTKLHRDVAVKVLPAQFASQPERVARFEREAQLLASLNHGNIAHIYGVEDAHGHPALVMELVPGKTLAEVLQAGALPLPDALAIARQIADALEAAHEKGIIHRDLKPGNVMITPDGQAKVLDFGLGKSVAAESDADVANSPTLTAATQAGMLIGTAAYMAPEQAKGRATDRRSDVWAFGCVLFLTGRRAFEGEDVSDTLAAILRGEPDWTALPADTPAHVVRVLKQCLQKDRKRRLHDIGDVQLALDQPDAAVSGVAVPAPADVGTPWRLHLAWLTVLVVVSAVTGAAMWWLREPALPQETRLDVNTPSTTASPYHFAISPDGQQIVFNAASDAQPSMLWIRPLDSTAARPLPGTEGGTYPFWSPDSRSIGFLAGSTIKRLELAEGATSHVQPQFLPDGRHFIFYCVGSDNVRGETVCLP